MAEFKLQFNEKYIADAIVRFRKQVKTRFLRIGLKLVSGVGLVVLITIFIFIKHPEVDLLFIVFLVLLLIGPKLDLWVMMRRFRKSPFYENNVNYVISKNGIKMESENCKSELSWNAFTNICRFSDGFLIFSGPQAFHWLPDSSLISGSLEDAELLFRK